MEVKALLKSFWQLANVIQIVSLQTAGMFLLAYSVGSLAMGFGVRGCPPREGFFTWVVIVKLCVITSIGVSALFLSFLYIVKPCVWMQKINKHLVFAPTDVHLPFFSTHPLYVFIDVLFFIPAIALFQSGRMETMCQLNTEWAFGWTLIIITILIPLFRVFSWYVLGRKIEAMTIDKPWLPIAVWYVFALPLFIYFTYNYMDKKVFPMLRVPVVNELTFKGGLSNHPEFEGKIVRVQGKLVRGIAKCGLFGKDETKVPYPYGTVLLDLGKRNGEIIVQVKKPSEVDDLEIEAENKKDKIFEAFGKLSKLPNPEKRMICGIGKADSKQRGGLALLEVEMP